MDTSDLERTIQERLGGTSAASDLITMIGLVAEARAAAHGRQEPTLADRIFGGGILCEFFRPLKVSAFVYGAMALRETYAGISQVEETREAFKESMTPELLGAASVTEAVSLGFDALFRPEGEATASAQESGVYVGA